MKGFIVYSDYELQDNETVVRLFGRLENGQSFAAVNDIEPYFFLKETGLEKIEKYLGKFKVEKTNLTDFNGEKVVKISGTNHIELNKLYDNAHKTVDIYEADIKPHFRFMIDNDILGSVDIEGEHESIESAGIDSRVDRVYKNPVIKPSAFKPKLKIVSIDTESNKKTGELYCIGLYGENYKKVFIVSSKKLEHAISCKNEEECIEKFKAELLKLDPDVITGWNVIDFDLQYLKEKFSKNKIKFDIGRSNSEARLRIEKNFFRSSSADIEGRQVLDGMNLIRDPFIKEAPSIKNIDINSFALEDVSQAILGTGKMLKGKYRHEEIDELYKKNQQKLVDYNLLDCKLVYDILEKTGTVELAVERSQLTGMPLDRITASIASFDSLYIREARKRRIVSPTIVFGLKEKKIMGGYVESLQAGIYNNVLVLDFKSLYPSIIKTFNIDPASYLEKKEKNAIESPNQAYFKNQDGVLPEIITKLHEEREKAKREKKELASYAIKIIMNSFFGVLASPNCRYFNLKIANAITHFGQFIIKLTAKEIEKLGYRVIYIDTDGVFVETNLSKEKADTLGKKIQEHINKFYQDYARKNYNRKSYLELEFEKQYLVLMMPRIRVKAKEGTKEGAKEGETAKKEIAIKAAKKRYAGLIEKNGKEEIEIVGLEAIRGDWTDAAQEFQIKLLDKVFHKKEIASFIKSYIKELKSGKLDDKLVYRKSIRKELSEYTKITPPHVKAARKLDKLDSSIIEYYITTDGPEPIQKLKHKIDYEHYIEKQIKPIANQILTLFDKTFDDIMQSSKQAKLF